MHSFTIDDLLIYLYGEMKPFEKTAIESELENNWALNEKFKVLKEAMHRLEKLKLHSPMQKTVNKIMEYALKAYKLSS